MTLYQNPTPSIADPLGKGFGARRHDPAAFDLGDNEGLDLGSVFGSGERSLSVLDEGLTATQPPQTKPTAALRASSSMHLYITAAQRQPMLSYEQEQLLWAHALLGRPGACNADGSLVTEQQISRANDAKEKLVASHLRLIISTARQYAGYEVSQEDLIQEGTVGLLKAIDRFDPTNGARLCTYGLHWIRSEMQEYIVRNVRMVKMTTTKPMRKLFFNLRTMVRSMRQAEDEKDGESFYGRNLTTDEVKTVAAALNVPEDDVREMHLRLSGADYSVEYISDESDDRHSNRMSAWMADTSTSPEVVLQHRRGQWQAHEGVKQGILTLDARSRDIIESRWLVEDDEIKLTLHDLAARYGVSAERIRQIESAALKKLRAHLGASHAMN